MTRWLLLAGAALAIVAATTGAIWAAIAHGRELGRQECREAAAAEFRENTDELFRLSARARAQAAADAAAADRLRAASDRVRGAVAGSGLVIRSASARGSEPASQAELVSAELLRRAEELARLADDSHRAGEACVAAYGAVR